MTPTPSPQPGILDFFRGRTTTPTTTAALPEPPVITGELVPVSGSEVEPITPASELVSAAAEVAAPPKNENLVDFHTDVSADAYKQVYSLVSPRSGNHFLIAKVWKHPVSVSGVLRDTLLDTYYFPLPNNAPIHTLVGCVIKGYLIREVYEQYGVSYILFESVTSEYEVTN